ncbi:class I SAM-dependent methyltransferase [Noviherbaspirillum sp. Root189]|uniref:class I SAM-dependent methyltransferase n=1 Tax=Noviherbaspirillum sp. Root189 TaxID=1736487 RepID=UPI0007089275|nr:class I SAM-dependent methyltransferase [Noviherbaspirillum sp. Root189]KRB87637.1 SAM-dependent methyltransferase [Noviherbaspirillum sp. Root189]
MISKESTVHAHSGNDSPSSWVVRFAALIPQGEVLDLACGSGRHARFLAARGYDVLAVDRDSDALQRAAGPRIKTMLADLEGGGPASAPWPFKNQLFSGIVVTNYLHRPLFPHFLDSLAPGGVLLYETFAIGNEQFGKPSNPAFLLQPGELLDLTVREDKMLRVIAYEDGFVDTPKPAMIQRICLIKVPPVPSAEGLRLF